MTTGDKENKILFVALKEQGTPPSSKKYFLFRWCNLRNVSYQESNSKEHDKAVTKPWK